MLGAEMNASFDIAVNYRYVPRGTSGGEENGWTSWQTDWTTWTNVPVAMCDGTQTEGASGWQWSIDLATLLERCKVRNAFTDSTSFGFGSRKFDRAEVEVHIKSQYIEGRADASGNTCSTRTDATVLIECQPEYVIERIRCDSLDALKIDYSAYGWERVDDRWQLELLEASGASILFASMPWGAVARHSASGEGVVIVPTESLSRLPIGEAVVVELRLNPSYRAAGAEFARAAYSGACKTDGGCNTPTLSASATSGGVSVAVGDSGDKGKPIESCLLKLVGSKYPFDQRIVAPGGTATFPFAPRGVPISFTVLGVAKDGSLSKLVKAEYGAVEPLGAVELVSLADPSVRAVARWNVRLEDEYAPEREAVKLAGRERQSAFYGEGGSGGQSLSFDILPDDLADDFSETESAWRKAAEAGDLLMLRRDGSRTPVSLSNAKFSRAYDSPVVSVTTSLSEVSI